MTGHDIRAALPDLPELRITPGMTEEEAAGSMQMVGQFNQCFVGLIRFSGQTPWERHTDDELLHILEGEVDVTVLTDDGPVQTALRAGSVFIVPRGLWHRQLARPSAALLFITGETEASTAEDPR